MSDGRKAAMLECRNLIQKMLEEYMRDHFTYDPDTGAWESRNETSNATVEAWDDAIAAIDKRIAAEPLLDDGAPP